MTRLGRHGPELTLLAAFALTRLVARIGFGLRFDADVAHYWHVLDFSLLRGDLARSVLLHIGFNLLSTLFLVAS